MSLFLGIDLGTSYFKVALFDLTGSLRGLGRVPVDKLTPAPGRFELPPTLFWHYLRRALTEALVEARAHAGEIGAVSYSSQASTFLLLDRHDEPITPLIFWNDTRGESAAGRLRNFSRSAEFQQAVGYTGVSGQTAACKWVWFQESEPAVWARAHHIMTLADYFTFSLTGERAGDAGTAAFLGIYDLSRHGWWPQALATFGIDADKLSKPLQPGSPCGRTTVRAAQLLGIPAGIPFAVGSLDHHAGAMGAGLGVFSDVSISTGTVLAALSIVDTVVPRPQCYHGLHTDGVRYYCLAFDQAGAAQLEDYQRRSAPNHTIAQLLTLAGAAHRDSSGGIHGEATLRLLEAVGFTQRRLVTEVARGHRVEKIVATGGGSRSPLWLQIQADILNVPVVTSASPEQGCLGAAAFAAVAAGCFPSIDAALSAMVHTGDVYQPIAANVSRYCS